MSYVVREIGELKYVEVTLKPGAYSLYGSKSTVEVREEMTAWMVYKWEYELPSIKEDLGWQKKGILLEKPETEPETEPGSRSCKLCGSDDAVVADGVCLVCFHERREAAKRARPSVWRRFLAWLGLIYLPKAKVLKE